MIMKDAVWEIVPRIERKSIVTSKWIYKIKHVADVSIEKHKARFVTRGFSQKEGIDYEETFASVARYTCIGCSNEMEGTPNGCQDNILEWSS